MGSIEYPAFSFSLLPLPLCHAAATSLQGHNPRYIILRVDHLRSSGGGGKWEFGFD